MEYIYSAMLLHTAGKEITEQGIAKVLEAAGVKPDESKIKALTASLEGVDIEEAIATPAQIVASASAAPAPGAAPATEEKKDKKDDDKEDDVSEDDAAAGLGALFG